MGGVDWDLIVAHIVSGTGWTWQHVRHECDLPTYFALRDLWREVPPAAVQLRRIASFLGLKPGGEPGAPRMANATGGPAAPSSVQEVSGIAAMAGMPVIQGRPADPMFDLIEPAPPPAAATVTTS